MDVLTCHEFDFAIGFDQKTIPKGYKSDMLYQEHYVCMCRREHPKIQDTLSLDNFLDERHVIVREKEGAIGVVNTALEKLALLSRSTIV